MELSALPGQLFDVGGRGDAPPREMVEEIVRNHWQAIANRPYGEPGGLQSRPCGYARVKVEP
jgi:hypothetical protein